MSKWIAKLRHRTCQNRTVGFRVPFVRSSHQVNTAEMCHSWFAASLTKKETCQSPKTDSFQTEIYHETVWDTAKRVSRHELKIEINGTSRETFRRMEPSLTEGRWTMCFGMFDRGANEDARFFLLLISILWTDERSDRARRRRWGWTHG